MYLPNFVILVDKKCYKWYTFDNDRTNVRCKFVLNNYSCNPFYILSKTNRILKEEDDICIAYRKLNQFYLHQ